MIYDRHSTVDIRVDLDEIQGEIVTYVSENLRPEEVFDVKELAEWAEDNGYEKEDEDGRPET